MTYLQAQIKDNDSPLFWYIGEGSKRINMYLRLGIEENLDGFDIKGLQRMIMDFECPNNLIAYRYISKKEFVWLFKKTAFGKTIRYPSFISTTLIKELYAMDEIKRGRILIKLYIPQGTKGVYIPEVNPDLPEIEFLLSYGLQIKRIRLKEYMIV